MQFYVKVISLENGRILQTLGPCDTRTDAEELEDKHQFDYTKVDVEIFETFEEGEYDY